MNNEISNKPCGCGNCEPMCTTCGRPWIVCKGECGCKDSCCCNKKVNFCEYGRMAHGCIRERAPECPMQAVIPSVVVDNISNLKNLADCFVHVTSLNTTFYIDDKHRTMITWAGPVEYDNYDLATNTLGLRSQFLVDFANNKGAYYNAIGEYKEFSFGGGSEDGSEVYTIALSDTQGVATYASLNWNLRNPFSIYGILAGATITKKDGTAAVIADMMDDVEGLAAAEYKFTIGIPAGDGGSGNVPLEITANPTAVTESQSGTVIISGTYSLDESFLSNEPDSLLVPPLRWKLVLFAGATGASFTAETISVQL